MSISLSPTKFLEKYKWLAAVVTAKKLKRKSRWSGRNRSGAIGLNGFRVEYTDMLSLYMEYKDIFWRRIYHFDASTSSPMIIDGGGCIGMSLFYFKKIFPEARITCFEPDPTIFKVLERNMTQNSLNDITLIQAGLAREKGTVTFIPDGSDGGRMEIGEILGISVPTVPLSEYIDTTIDFMKLNIEGQEWPVLEELEEAGKLPLIRQMVIEYHGWAGKPQKLGAILDLLERNGFRFVVHDFDAESCGTSKPPFRITPETRWFCLIYARAAF